jgi:hypothetical protein
MSYYILPKNINIINVNPSCSYEQPKNYLSYSLSHYYYQSKKQISDMFLNSDISNNNFDEAIKIINPYEFIFSRVPGSKFSVSKLKPKTNIFYDLFEIINNLNIFEQFNTKSIKSLHVSKNNTDSINCFEILRENFNDEIYCHNNNNIDTNIDTNIDKISHDIKFDFIFYEMDNEKYFHSIINAIILLLKNQSHNGTIIIKISEIFHKPIVDALYFLTSLYEKVYICKPNTNNITLFDKYILCKNFLHNEKSNLYLKLNYLKLIVFLKKLENKNITEILDFNLPYYFKNKIDDINIIIGQQQLESLDQIITIYKNKNKDEKIESIKKSNIQKSVSWCEKYKIPCNKFTEKINIFLPIINKINENEINI